MKDWLVFFGQIGIGVLCMLFPLTLFIPITLDYWNEQTYIVTNLSVTQEDDRPLFNVTTEDGDELTFESRDLLFMNTNSNDVTTALKQHEGRCHLKITTRGYRIPRGGIYQNIVKFEVIE